MDEKEYLNSNYSHDSMQRAKKTAKLWIVVSFVGILAGISAAGVLLFEYKLVLSPFLAVLSGKFNLKFLRVFLRVNFLFLKIFLIVILAGIVLYIHIQFTQNVWQIWTNHLKLWRLFGLISQVPFVILFILFLVWAIQNGQCKCD